MKPNYSIQYGSSSGIYFSDKSCNEYCLILDNYPNINIVSIFEVYAEHTHYLLSNSTVAIFKVKKKTKTIDSLHSK